MSEVGLQVSGCDFHLRGISDLHIGLAQNLFGWTFKSEEVPPKGAWAIAIDNTRPFNVHGSYERVPLEYDETALLVANSPRRLFMERSGGVIEIDRQFRAASIFNPWDRGRFIDLYRLIRQVVIADLINSGFVCLHASAVEKDGRVIAFSGPKGAGKTTHASQLAFAHGYRWVANDKLFLHQDGTAYGIPEAPAVSPDWPVQFPSVKERWPQVCESDPKPTDIFFDHRPLPTWNAIEAGNAGPEKLLLSDHQLVSLLGTDHSSGGTLSAFFLIGLDVPESSDGKAANIDLIAEQIDQLESYGDWSGLRRKFADARSLEHLASRVRTLYRSGSVASDVKRALQVAAP